MSADKETTEGCLLLLVAFLGVGFGLPLAGSVVISSENLTSKVIAWVFLALVVLIAVVAIPNLMLVWVGMAAVAFIAIWVLGDSAGTCVPVSPGSCD